MKRFSLCVLGCIVLLSVFSQDKPALSIPQLLQKAKDGRTDTARPRWQLQAAYAYVLKRGEDPVDLDSALLLVEQVGKANERIHDESIQALCYMVYSHAYRELKRPDLGKKNSLLAVEACRKLPDSLELGFALMEAATYYDYNNVKEDAVRVELYRRAAPIFEHAGRIENQAAALELLGDCLLNVEPSDYVEALQVMLRALKIYNAVGHTALANLYTLLGRAYSSIGGYLDSAQPYAERIRRVSDSMSLDDNNRIHVDGDIVRYELKARQYELARKDAMQYKNFLIRNQRWPQLVSLYYDLFRVDSGSGDFRTAVDDYQRYTKLKDSLLRVAKSKQIAALELDYETEKKDKDIAVLTRGQALGRAELRQADLTRNTVIAGSVLLFVLLIVSYNRYRTKRRSNYLLRSARSMGMLLIDSLNQQLEGRLGIKSGRGLIVSIVFKHSMERRDPLAVQAAENELISYE